MDSILASIKKLLFGVSIADEYECFDEDIIMHINSVLSILNELGVGPKKGFSIIDSSSNWSDFLGNKSNIELIKSYVYLKVRLLFDPPTNSAVIESINKQISELEWRINVMVDPGEKEENQNAE